MGILDYALLLAYALFLIAVTVCGAQEKDGRIGVLGLAVVVFVLLMLTRAPRVPVGQAVGGAVLAAVGGVVLPAVGFYLLGAFLADRPRRLVFTWLVSLLPFSVYLLLLILLVVTQLQCSPGAGCP
ncbi:MAG: hypothetical protein ACYDHH_15165 [Solirubrobacteraceae bacterium]